VVLLKGFQMKLLARVVGCLVPLALAAVEPPVASSTATNASPSIQVPLSDPVMRQPAPEVLQDFARRERVELMNRGTQEAMDERMKASLRPRTPEESGAALRHLSRDRSLRSVVQLFDPFAPVPKAYSAANSAFEKPRSIDEHLPPSLRGSGVPSTPRTFIDPIRHEAGLRLW